MGQQLPDRDFFFTVLSELGPICGNAFVVIEPPARVGDRERHRRQTLGGRVDDHHRILLPRFAGRPVANPAPEVDHLFATMINATGAAEFVAAGEIFGEGFTYGFEALPHETFNSHSLRYR